MAITFPIVGASNSGTSTDPSFTLGTSPVENDIIVVNLNAPTSINDISGWTNVLGPAGTARTANSEVMGTILYHRVTAAEDTANTTSWTLTSLLAGSATWVVTVTVLRGAATSGELVGFATRINDSGFQSSINVPTIVPPESGCRIMVGVNTSTGGTQTAATGHTEQSFTSSPRGTGLYSADAYTTEGVETPTGSPSTSHSAAYSVSIAACFAPVPTPWEPFAGVAPAAYTASRSPSFTLGTSPVENDIIVVSATSSTTAATTDVSGWVNVQGPNTSTSPSDATLTAVMVYHRVTAAEDAANTVTWTLTNLWDATEDGRVTVTVLRGVATSGELVGVASGSDAGNTATPWVIPTVTPTADGCAILAVVAGDYNETQTTPSGWTKTVGSAGTAGSNYSYLRVLAGSAGVATGTTNVTPSTGDEYVSIVACFAPHVKRAKGVTPVACSQAVNRAGSW